LFALLDKRVLDENEALARGCLVSIDVQLNTPRKQGCLRYLCFRKEEK
jgi:hypothetical protein